MKVYSGINIKFNQFFPLLILFVMSTQFVAIEGFMISPVKVALMSFCFVIFFIKVPYVSRALMTSSIYLFTCFAMAFLQEQMRINTIAYLGMFLITFVVYYNFIYSGVFTLQQFKKISKYFIYIFFVFLVTQQFFIIMGFRDIGILNLADSYLLSIDNSYYKWNRLPALTCEPSHTARIIAAAMLGYIRCLELENKNKISIKTLMNKENIFVSLAFLWLTFTMGSGTGWIGIGILALYFVNYKNLIYSIPILLCISGILYYSNNEQFMRAVKTAEATLTGDINIINKADGSSSVRVIPLVNTFFKTDLGKSESWIGKGTLTKSESINSWRNFKRKISPVEQYGLIGFFASLIFVFGCVIYKFFSIETLFFIFLLLCSVGNEYFIWSMLLFFTTIRYFQKQAENGCIDNHSKL